MVPIFVLQRLVHFLFLLSTGDLISDHLQRKLDVSWANSFVGLVLLQVAHATHDYEIDPWNLPAQPTSNTEGVVTQTKLHKQRST